MHPLFFILLLFLMGGKAHADDYIFGKSKDNKVEFEATGNPGFLRIVGVGSYVHGMVRGDERSFRAEMEVPLKEFDTGIMLRNKHMKEKYLEVDKYPEAKLVIENLTGFKQGEEFFWRGRLTIKNNSKPVNGTATVKGKKIKANFKVLISDYPEIGVPSYLGITVTESVEVRVEATAL